MFDNSNNVRTEDDEKNLLKMIHRKLSIDDISKILRRDPRSVELRLQKIIYENVVNDKHDPKFISAHLNLPEEIIKNYVLIYKQYKQKYERRNNIETKEKQNELNEIDQKIEKLEKENKFIRMILENRELHKRIDGMIKSGKMSQNIKDIIMEMRK